MRVELELIILNIKFTRNFYLFWNNNYFLLQWPFHNNWNIEQSIQSSLNDKKIIIFFS